jgi:hypothetical protein
MKISMFEIVGDFGEDKDAAASLRDAKIRPSIQREERVYLDFDGVTLVTQSFIHALISDVLRTTGEDTLDLIEFENCAGIVRGIISTVVQYSLDSMSESDSLRGESLRKGAAQKKKGDKPIGKPKSHQKKGVKQPGRRGPARR